MPLDMKQTLTETRDACIKMQVSLAVVNKQVSDLLFMLEHPLMAIASGKDAGDVAPKLAIALGAFVESFKEFAEATRPLTGGTTNE